MSATTAATPARFYLLQERRPSGEWRTLPQGGYRREGYALDRLGAVADGNPGGTFRVIVGSDYHVDEVIAVRNPR